MFIKVNTNVVPFPQTMQSTRQWLAYHHQRIVAALEQTPAEQLKWAYQNMDIMDKHATQWTKCPECLKQIGQIKPGNAREYLVTFTRNPNSKYTVEQWRQAVLKQLKRHVFIKGDYAFEHEDTNIHCHAYVTSKGIHKTNFESFAHNYGHVDIKTVKQDNGIHAYIGKENEIKSFVNVSYPTSQTQPNGSSQTHIQEAHHAQANDDA